MPNTLLDEHEERDIYKSRIYKLCDFLIAKRESPKYQTIGIARPLHIPLLEMSEILHYIPASTPESKIEKLKETIEHLNEDSITDTAPTTVIAVKNPDILTNFVASFNTNKIIIIKCSVESLKAYKAKLIERTQETESAYQGFKFKNLSASFTISLGNKTMTVTAGNRQTATDIPLKLSLLRLLYGKKIKVIGRDEEISIKTFDTITRTAEMQGYHCSDYQLGHNINIEVLTSILSYVKEPEIFPTRNTVAIRKSITTAILQIEKDSLTNLGRTLLVRTDDKTGVHIDITH